MAESIRAAREALRQGELVGIFPEGGITRSGEIQEFRPGFLSILKDTGAPVVPVYLGGLWGSIFQLRAGPLLLEMAPPLALSRHHPLRQADPAAGER